MMRKQLILGAIATSIATIGSLGIAQEAQAIDFSTGGWTKVTIDFESYTDANGAVKQLEAGDIINSQWSNLGLDISATNDNRNNKNSDGLGTLMIFDSDCKLSGTGKCSGNDPDLATGDANVGSGLETEDNVLIIQELDNRGNLRNSPDDEAAGGKITFDISTAKDIFGFDEIRWGSIMLIDIDSNPTAEDVTLSANGDVGVTVKDLTKEMLKDDKNPVLFAGVDGASFNPNQAKKNNNKLTQQLNKLGDNSILELDISELVTDEFAKTLDVDFRGSGAIASLSFYYRSFNPIIPPTAVPTPAAVLPIIGSMIGAASRRRKQGESTEE